MEETAAPEPAPTPAPARPHESGDCARRLAERFPALFGGAPKPLKLRIQADIQEQAPGEFTKNELSAFFRRHTGSTSYLFALVKATTRFGLDGAPAGELSEEHRRAAVDELARRRAIRDERRRVEEEQRHNRATLLRDFERTTLTPANFCALKGIAPDALDGLLTLAREEAAAEAQWRSQHPPRDRPARPPGDRPTEGRSPHGRPRGAARR